MAAADSANGSAKIVCSNLIMRPEGHEGREGILGLGRVQGLHHGLAEGSGAGHPVSRVAVDELSGAACSSGDKWTSRTPGRRPGARLPLPRRRAWAPPSVAARSSAGRARRENGRNAETRRTGRGQLEARLSVPRASPRPSARRAATSARRPPMCRFERGHSTTVAPVVARGDGRRLRGVDHVDEQPRRGPRRRRPARPGRRRGDVRGTRAATSTPMEARTAGQRPEPSRRRASFVLVLGDVDGRGQARAGRRPRRCGEEGRRRRSRGACGAGT